jgi:hypothetical protein
MRAASKLGNERTPSSGRRLLLGHTESNRKGSVRGLRAEFGNGYRYANPLTHLRQPCTELRVTLTRRQLL